MPCARCAMALGDRDADGLVSAKEAALWAPRLSVQEQGTAELQAWQDALRAEFLARAFRAMDTNGDGELQDMELETAAASLAQSAGLLTAGSAADVRSSLGVAPGQPVTHAAYAAGMAAMFGV